jgi:hypothetical protein
MRKTIQAQTQKTHNRTIQESSKRVASLVVCLLDEKEPRRIFDSTEKTHQDFMKSFGPLRWTAFQLPLNGQGDQFQKISGTADYLILHQSKKKKMTAEDIEALISRLKIILVGNRRLQIFTTPGAKFIALQQIQAVDSLDTIKRIISNHNHTPKKAKK